MSFDFVYHHKDNHHFDSIYKDPVRKVGPPEDADHLEQQLHFDF